MAKQVNVKFRLAVHQIEGILPVVTSQDRITDQEGGRWPDRRVPLVRRPHLARHVQQISLRYGTASRADAVKEVQSPAEPRHVLKDSRVERSVFVREIGTDIGLSNYGPTLQAGFREVQNRHERIARQQRHRAWWLHQLQQVGSPIPGTNFHDMEIAKVRCGTLRELLAHRAAPDQLQEMELIRERRSSSMR
jgi:hypothetical protein